MNAARAIGIVFLKEMRDALRDRRTLMTVFVSSVALGPLLLVLVATLVDKMERHAEAREIVVSGIAHAPTLRNFLERQTYVVKPAPADWEARLKASKLGDPVVVIAPTFEDELAHGEAPRIELDYASGDARAAGSVTRIEHVLQGFDQEQAALRLIARGVAPGVLSVVRLDTHDVADSAARAAQITGMIPYLVMMAVLYGSLGAALDTTAGERERGSLEPLLATPAARGALVVGKWGAAFCVGLLIAVLSCVSFIPSQKLLRSESLAALFHFGWFEVAAFIGLLIPFAAALSALMMALAIRCRTFKEAQASTMVLSLLVSVAPLMKLFNDEGESASDLWIPSIAQSTLMGRVLKGTPIALTDVAPGLATCAAVTALALWFVSRQLTKRAAQ